MLKCYAPKMLNIRLLFYISLRHKSSCRSYKTSEQIRKDFLDYFVKKNDHTFVKSSSIVPYCDATVPFVNAGMNQFKGIFLGLQQPISNKVANSQKCARVGGKHNDLNIIGLDGYHHTFFEMLGNWSFGDYSKKVACELAWNLLTGPYALEPHRLYVTYFGGDRELNLEPDSECRDIWREIGLPDDRIIPFGLAENFWEMGAIGPCGPCTEIHIDHSLNLNHLNKRQYVNKGFGNLTELWNIVFIQYNRIASGAVIPLPKSYVDTGMGFERLVAVLQKCKSNYDTDLFAPLLSTIQKDSKGNINSYKGTFGCDEQAKLDTAYRILADHSRLITICLTDGMIPDLNPKLRKILRKTIVLCEKHFNTDAKLIKTLSNVIAEILGDTYPEIIKNLSKVNHLISHEEEVLKVLRLDASKKWQAILKDCPELMDLDIIEFPGLVAGYKEIQDSIQAGNKSMPSELAYKLCDTYGFDEKMIKEIVDIKGLHFNQANFTKYVNLKKAQSKHLSSRYTKKEVYDLISTLKEKVLLTDDSFKYHYHYNEKYIFPILEAKVKAIIIQDKIVDKMTCAENGSLILDKSNFYYESGGQQHDIGRIKVADDIYFEVTNVNNVHGYLLHEGKFVYNKENDKNEFCLKINDVVYLQIDRDRRIKNMQNHTGVHLLQAAINRIFPDCVIAQTSSKVCSEYFSLGLAIYGARLTIQNLNEIQAMMRNIIKQGIPVSDSFVNSLELSSMDSVTLVPGEIYPENAIRLIHISNDGFHSKEACCGTHVFNTKHLEEFCITKFQHLTRCNTVIYGVTGTQASNVLQNSEEIQKKVKVLEKYIKENNPKITKSYIKDVRSDINKNPITYMTKVESLEIVDNLVKSLSKIQYQNLQDFIDVEMKQVMNLINQNQENFLVHNLICSSLMENVKLEKVTRYCKDKPVIVFSYSNGYVKARCCVPQDYINKNFNAHEWLKNSANLFNAEVTPPKGQNQDFVCNMKSKRILEPEWHDLLEKAVKCATDYAREHINKQKQM